jgi:acyl transferase domain-containing protein
MLRYRLAAAYACGALRAEDCWAIAYHRGRSSDTIATRAPDLNGSMMSVGLSAEKVVPYLDKLSAQDREQVVVACVNSPSNVTLSGASSILQQLELVFRFDKVFARTLKVEVAYHSPHMRVIAEDYLDAIKDIRPISFENCIVMASSVTGSAISQGELTADYCESTTTT